MKTTLLLAAFFLASAAGLWAANQPTITKQPEPSTFAKSATGRFYVSAASTDGGYLTYQWYRSGPFTTPFADPNGSDKNTILSHSLTAPETAGTGTSATLTTTTPATAGYYYYYWAKITNTKNGETGDIESAIVKAKIVDRSTKDSATKYDSYQYLYPELQNGDFSKLNTKQKTDNNPLACNVAPDKAGFPSFGWQTTHYATLTDYQPRCIEIRGNVNYVNDGYTNYGLTAQDEIRSDQHGVFSELSAANPSNLFQEIATVPGKIYEWSLDHSSRPPSGGGNPDVLAVIIGDALNSADDYGATTPYYNKHKLNDNTIVDIATQPAFNGKSLVDSLNGGPYVYGVNRYSYFQAIVDTVLRETGITAGNYTSTSMTEYFSKNFNAVPQDYVTTYNGKKYYVFLSSATRDINSSETGSRWRHRSGAYTVPSGQGISFFAFVDVHIVGVSGNIIDNIVFASGSPVSSNQEVSFTSEAQLSAATRPGYAYGLAEVRGSTAGSISGSVKAYYDADGAGESAVEALITADDKGWYIETSFADAGVITFKNLTPGKVYRVVGIPAAAISSALGVNERPEYVLDEGYYADTRILAASAGDTETVWNIDLEVVSGKARATIKNARSDVEYALIDSVGGGVQLAHTWTDWTTSANSKVSFDNLTLDTVYYLVVRPLGYGEVTYAMAAEAAVKIRTPAQATPDLSVADIARPTYTTITIANTKSGCDYAAVDTKTGQIVQQKQPESDGAKLSFEGLDAIKAYQMQIRYAGGSWMKGVRVYPYPSKLYIDYVNETIRSSADSTGNIPVNVEYRIMRKKKK